MEANQVFNQSEAKPAATGLLWRMSKGPWYRKTIRSLLPRRLKGRLRSALLPQVPPRPDPPTVETVDYIIDRVREDAQHLRHLMGWAKPIWDFDAVRRTSLDAASGISKPPGVA